MSTLRSGAHDHWPGWWTPVGVVDHKKSFCFYFLRLLSLGCAVLVKLLFPLHAGRSTLGKQLTGVCLVRVSVVSCFHLLFLWVSGVVVFEVVPWSPEESPEESYGPQLVRASTGLEATGIIFLPLSLLRATRWMEYNPRGSRVPPPLRVLVCTVYSRKPLPKRYARQGLTPPPADATLFPRQARREQVARDPGPARTEVGGMCVQRVRRGANRGLSIGEGVLASASAVRPRATPHTQQGHTDTTDTEQTRHTRSALCAAQPHAVSHTFHHWEEKMGKCELRNLENATNNVKRGGTRSRESNGCLTRTKAMRSTKTAKQRVQRGGQFEKSHHPDETT